MDLKLFFDPVDLDLDKKPSSFQNAIYINQQKMPDHEGLDIALIGLNEFRGNGTEAKKIMLPMKSENSFISSKKDLVTTVLSTLEISEMGRHWKIPT